MVREVPTANRGKLGQMANPDQQDLQEDLVLKDH